MIRLLFLTRSLGAGGTERQLTELARILDKERFALTVAVFYPGGARYEDLARLPGVQLASLQKRSRWDAAGPLRRAWRLARSVRPHVIYSFAYEPGLVGLLLARAAGARLVWGIRRSTKEPPRHDMLALVSYRLAAGLSPCADRVVYNSTCGRTWHLRHGYCARNAVVIANGFDADHFCPDVQARARQRAAWAIGDNERVIGIVGRLDPVKDHSLFLSTAARLAPDHPDLRVAIVGGGPDAYREQLARLAARLGIAERIIWAGERRDMPTVYNALDLLVLCSREEGFPNVVGEAMACAVPCVTSDVGDTALLVGRTGQVVPLGDADALARRLADLLTMSASERQALGRAGRQRILAEFSLSPLAQRTEAMLEELATKDAAITI